MTVSGKQLAIIVSHNGVPEIIRCIDSLRGSSYVPDLLVIDNNSSDGIMSKLIELKVDYIYLSENIGFGNAMNIGLRSAKEKGYEGVFLINQDVEVEKNCFRHILNSQERSCLISPIHLAPGESGLDNNFEKILKHSGINTENENWQETVHLKRIDFINAAFWYLPIEVINKIGGFHPAFFFTGEDVNYCNRLKFNGLSIKIETKAEIYHKRLRNLDSDSEARIRRASAEADVLQFLLNLNQPLTWTYITCSAFILKDYFLKSDKKTLGMRLSYFIKWTKGVGQIMRWRKLTKIQKPHFL